MSNILKGGNVDVRVMAHFFFWGGGRKLLWGRVGVHVCLVFLEIFSLQMLRTLMSVNCNLLVIFHTKILFGLLCVGHFFVISFSQDRFFAIILLLFLCQDHDCCCCFLS